MQTCVALFGIVYAYDRDMIERDMYVHTTACANPAWYTATYCLAIILQLVVK